MIIAESDGPINEESHPCESDQDMLTIRVMLKMALSAWHSFIYSAPVPHVMRQVWLDPVSTTPCSYVFKPQPWKHFNDSSTI